MKRSSKDIKNEFNMENIANLFRKESIDSNYHIKNLKVDY